MVNKGMMSTGNAEWATPQSFFDKWNALYHFDLDVCATAENAKCRRYFTAQDDGLTQEWFGRVWMNPPYGREIGKWVRKAYEYAARGGLCCLPAPGKNGHGMVA